MTDVSDRRREPKGIPTGGEFAKENSGAADAADLEEAAFERAEREADEYYSSLTDEDLERQWAEQTGSHPAPKPPAVPKGGTDPERDRLWRALAGQHTTQRTRARLARDPRLLALLGTDGGAHPVAALGSWGHALEWLGSDGRIHTSPLSMSLTAGMGYPSYEEYDGYSRRLAALRGRVPEPQRTELAARFGKVRTRQVEAEAGLIEWTNELALVKRQAISALIGTETLVKPHDKAHSDAPAKPKPRDTGSAKSAPRHPRLVRFASTVGKAGVVIVGGFLDVVRRALAPLGRR